MIILGHQLIEHDKFILVESMEELIRCGQENNGSCAIQVSTVKDAIFANAMGAKYMMVNKDMAIEIQQVANEYLFDSRVIVPISSEDEIEGLAKLGIDGVLFD